MVATKTPELRNEGMLGLFEKFEAAGAGKTPSWLQALRKGGIAHFAELGFPTIQNEEWRFTNVSTLAKAPLRLADSVSPKIKEKELQERLFTGFPCKRIVFVDGHFSAELSSKETNTAQGLKAMNLEEAGKLSLPLISQHLARYARYEENAFAALNTAFLSDGAFIVAPVGQVFSEPVYVIHVSTGAHDFVATHPRTLIIAHRGSQLKVVEHFISLGKAPSFTNSVVEVIVEESAHVEHCKIQEENLATYHVGTIHVQQGRSSNFLSHSISTGGLLTRNTITCALDGEGIESTLNGLYLGRDNQLVDHHTAIHHNKPNCNSHEYYHGILDGRSTGVFNGKIFVRPEAQKTDAKQNNRNILLSDDATVNTKPQLEIFADDVKCTHGATIGQLDPESIFYLRARGIGLENARKMLLHAFASEIVNRITIEPIQEKLDAQLFDLFEK